MILLIWWKCFNINAVNELQILQSFIENMLYMLHATYIKHNFYADFSLKLKKLFKENFLWQIHSLRVKWEQDANNSWS